MKILFFFIDGFGMGEPDNSRNPVFAANTPVLDQFFHNHTVIPTDAALGVPGLPQSATGQTAIFTGVNASQLLGRHLNGQPTESLKKVIREKGLFKELVHRGVRATNSNAYRQEYLDKMLDPRDRRHRPSVTSVMTMEAGMAFRTAEDFERGNGIYHDITGKILLENGYEVKLITPEEAGERFFRISREYDFTLFEHFMTDMVGHKQDLDAGIQLIEQIDAFLGSIYERMDLDNELLIIASDHGNIEDITVKTHTLHPVPTILVGKNEEKAGAGIRTIMDIYPAVLKLLGRDKP